MYISIYREGIMDVERALAMDTAHAELLSSLQSNGEYIRPPDDDRHYFLVLPHMYNDAGPLSQALDFAVLLRNAIIAEGYEAVLISNFGAMGGSLPMVQIPIEVNGVVTDITLNYCFIRNDGTPYYSLFMYDAGLQYGCGASRDSTSSLLDYIPTMITGIQVAIEKVPIYRECSSCHWGDDSGHHCGIGLVGTGECTHYMGSP